MFRIELFWLLPVVGAPVTPADVGHDESVGGQVVAAQAGVTHGLVHQSGRCDVGKSLNLLN